MATITFEPVHVTVPCKAGETILEIGRRHAVLINTSCVGRGTCGLCRVAVVAGEDHLSAFNPIEGKHLGNVYFLTKERLACQARVGEGDVTVSVPPPKKLP